MSLTTWSRCGRLYEFDSPARELTVTKQNKKKRRWLQQIVARLNRAYKKLPEPYWLKGEWPNWVSNVARELSKALSPTAHLKVSPDWEPGEVGAILGQQIAYCAYDSMPDLEVWLKKRASWKELRQTFGKDIKERVEKFTTKLEREFVPEFVGALKFAVGLAIEQEYEDTAKFFAALGRAIQRKPTNAADIGRTNTRIYVFLLTHWRSVEKLGSVPALHKVLCKVFGDRLVGVKVKRVEKICERVGLSYREIAEREERQKSPQK
jgi:hypothetical protein